MLRTRILTALVIFPVTLAVVFLATPLVFKGAIAVLLLIGCLEFRRICDLSPTAGVALLALVLGAIVLGCGAYEAGNILGGVVFRGSWQPTQLACSPGCKWVNVRIVITAMPFSSRAWNCNGTPAGASNATDPLSSTGTVPTTRLSTSNLTALE